MLSCIGSAHDLTVEFDWINGKYANMSKVSLDPVTWKNYTAMDITHLTSFIMNLLNDLSNYFCP